MSARLVVDRRGELFGAAVTIADLAVHSFNDLVSEQAHIYDVWAVLERDWRDELDRSASEMEYATGVAAHFRDGSILHVGAWADCCDATGCRHCRG